MIAIFRKAGLFLVLSSAVCLSWGPSATGAQEPAQPVPSSPQSPAPAQPGTTMTEEEMDDEQARAHFRVGRRHYSEGRFEEAGRDFEEAYQLSRRSELLYNVYVAWREAQNFEKAADALSRYLQEMPDAPDRPRLEQSLARLQASIEQQRRIDSGMGTEVQAESTAPSPSSSRQSQSQSPSVWPWVVVGTGGAMIVAGSITGALALGKMGEIEDACPNESCPPSFDLASSQDTVDTLSVTTDILIFGGIAAVAGGIVWALLDDGGASSEEERATALGCSSDGCAASVKVRF